MWMTRDTVCHSIWSFFFCFAYVRHTYLHTKASHSKIVYINQLLTGSRCWLEITYQSVYFEAASYFQLFWCAMMRMTFALEQEHKQQQEEQMRKDAFDFLQDCASLSLTTPSFPTFILFHLTLCSLSVHSLISANQSENTSANIHPILISIGEARERQVKMK